MGRGIKQRNEESDPVPIKEKPSSVCLFAPSPKSRFSFLSKEKDRHQLLYFAVVLLYFSNQRHAERLKQSNAHPGGNTGYPRISFPAALAHLADCHHQIEKSRTEGREGPVIPPSCYWCEEVSKHKQSLWVVYDLLWMALCRHSGKKRSS